jgi:hypothetical protein
MALIECPECKASVSDKASACPKCGYPLHQAQIAPRFDGIYVSRSVTQDHLELPGDWLGNVFRKLSRPKFVRAYLRFYEEGLVVYAGAIVSDGPEPARPTLHRTWGDEHSRLQWTVTDGRLQITSANGYVSSATVDGNRLTWDFIVGPSPDHGVFEFHAA